MVRGIVLAAGESRRMGQPKAGLQLAPGGPTFAAAVVAVLQQSQLDEVVVVAGAHPEAVRASLLGVTGVRVIEHAAWSDGQLSSLRAGLEAVASADLDAVLVALVDCPRVRASTVGRLIETWRTTRAPIVRPAIGARHGHPVIFDRAAFDDIRCAPLDVGAKAVIARWQHALVNVTVDDAGVLADVDTPADYEAFLRARERDG
jgi:CTP:molybdopterin cytidylyltransferase MocA